MASSRNSPGPHDRRDYTQPPATCAARTRFDTKCKRGLAPGQRPPSGLCKFHLEKARAMAQEQLDLDAISSSGRQRKKTTNPNGPSPSMGDLEVARQSRKLNKTFNISQFALNERARTALTKLGLSEDPELNFDPKRSLLSAVESSHRQRLMWEALLASVPEGDYSQIGVVPIPGLQETSRGARIELIQRNLNLATKDAAKISKMAIDAGIEERLVRLAEEQSALIADTVRAGVIAAIGSLHLSPAAEKAAIEAALSTAAVRLRVLASGIDPDAQLVPGSQAEIIEGLAHEVFRNG